MRRFRGFAACCALALASCSHPTEPRTEAERLAAHRELWSALGVTSYRYTVKLHGAWFSGAAVVEVRDGVPVSVTAPGGGSPQHLQVFEGHDTVEELFAVVHRAIEQQADRLETKYSRIFGFPSYVDVDVRLNTVDEEHGFTVADFQVLR